MYSEQVHNNNSDDDVAAAAAAADDDDNNNNNIYIYKTFFSINHNLRVFITY